MKALYLFLILFGLLIVYRTIKLIQKRKKQAKDPLLQAIKIMDDMANDNITVEGKAPGGYGEFGHEKTNPIPVRGMMGATKYLSSLRSNEGDLVEYSRIGQALAANINNPVDMYEIKVNGEFHCKLFFCAYFKTMSNVAPEGFRLDLEN